MKSPTWKELLQKLRVFETVRDDKKFDRLLEEGASTERVFAKGDVIIRRGWIGDSIFLIGSGAVELLLEPAEGDLVVLGVIGRGEMFGEMAFFDRDKRTERSATARAKEASTLLEIHASGLQEILDEHPDVEFKLLLMLSDRLRHANAQILGLQLSNVDEKLKFMTARLDAEHMVFDAQLTAAGKVFDQTKLRADEVITSAERSRDRLNKSALLMGTFVTIAVGLLGLFGLSKVSDIDRARVEVVDHAKQAGVAKKLTEDYRDEAQKSTNDMKKIKAEAEASNREAKNLLAVIEEVREGVTDIYRARFIAALEKGSAADANQAYLQIKKARALPQELQTLLSEIERQVVARAQPPRSPQELSEIKTFGALLQQAVVDADAGRLRDKLDAYYLLLVYASLTEQTDFEHKDNDFREIATRQDARAALQKYVDGNSGARPRTASAELTQRLSREAGKRGDDLQDFARLAKVSRGRF